MKTLAEIHINKNNMYTVEHIWLNNAKSHVTLGISDYAQDQLGEIVFVDLPEVGTHFNAGAGFGTIESMKSVNTLYMPLGGTIARVNNRLADTPTLVNISCYDQGWLVHVVPDTDTDKELLSPARYQEFLQSGVRQA